MKLIIWNAHSHEGVKPHFVPDSLMHTILTDIGRRFHAPVLQTLDRTGELMRIDRGGPMMISAEWVSVDIDNATLEVPVRDIEVYYMDLLQSPLRGEPGAQYYKLHGWLHCVVLTPEQRKTILFAWGTKLQEYHDKAEREQAEYTAKVMELNKHPNIQLSVPKPMKPIKKSELN
jgi:hypothetical protein